MSMRKPPGPFVWVMILLLACWVCYAVVWARGGMVQKRETAAELAALEREIERLEREIERTDVHLRNLRSNRRYLLGYAREQGYRMPDEVIFKFIPKSEQEKPR
jgi:cell division protein FtsB